MRQEGHQLLTLLAVEETQEPGPPLADLVSSFTKKQNPIYIFLLKYKNISPPPPKTLLHKRGCPFCHQPRPLHPSPHHTPILRFAGLVMLHVSRIEKQTFISHVKPPTERQQPGVFTWDEEDSLNDNQRWTLLLRLRRGGLVGLPKPVTPGTSVQDSCLRQPGPGWSCSAGHKRCSQVGWEEGETQTTSGLGPLRLHSSLVGTQLPQSLPSTRTAWQTDLSATLSPKALRPLETPRAKTAGMASPPCLPLGLPESHSHKDSP